jgi:outer membrane immunogenic protein
LVLFAAVASMAAAARADGYEPWGRAPVVRAALPWNGPYVGLSLGYVWHDTEGVFNNAGTATDLSALDPNGGLVGGQVGWNARYNWFLLGVEADASTATNSGKVSDPGTGAALSGDLSYLASIRGRLGFIVSDVLFYGTAGVGFSKFNFLADNGISSVELTLRDTGAVYGGGIEWMIAYGVSIRGEYLRYDMEEGTFVPAGIAGATAGDFIKYRDADVARAGLNIRLAP